MSTIQSLLNIDKQNETINQSYHCTGIHSRHTDAIGRV